MRQLPVRVSTSRTHPSSTDQRKAPPREQRRDIVSLLFLRGFPLVVAKILSQLTAADLARSMLVSRTWRGQVASSSLLVARVRLYRVQCKRNAENMHVHDSCSSSSPLVRRSYPRPSHPEALSPTALTAVDCNLPLELPSSFALVSLAVAKGARLKLERVRCSPKFSSRSSCCTPPSVEDGWSCCCSCARSVERGTLKRAWRALAVDDAELAALAGLQTSRKRLRRL